MSQLLLRTILCPVDLSSASPTVLSWARLFAETYHAKVEVLHVDWLEYPPYFFPSQAAELSAQAEHHRAALNENLTKLAHENLGSNVPYEISILEGHPVDTILRHAATLQPDLIVMGSHGRSGLARMRLGSVAENVVRETSIPTLVVRALANKQAPAHISRVLCPVSFSEHGRRCLEVSADVAATFGAQLVVVHAVEQEGADLHQVHDQLCQWVPGAVRGRCDLLEVVRRGNAAEQILLAAREQAVELIVLVAQHRPFLEITTLGTTTERVMRHSDSAVLALPGKQLLISEEPPKKSVTSTI
jgi:nucleotide-binding universal stress UspA family protein